MISSLMVERMPKASSHMLARSTVKGIIRGIGITGIGIMPGLDKHRLLAPVTRYPARGVMRTPVVHIVTPLAGKISNAGGCVFHMPHLAVEGRVSKQYRKMLMPARSTVATGVTIRIRIFLSYNICGLFGKILRIPSLVEHRLPQPYTSMIAVTAYQIAYVAIHTLCEFGSIIPELPPRSIDYDKQAKFVACVHEGRILRAMGIANHFHPGVTQFLGITPMDAVGNRIAYHREILMAVGTDQWGFIRFAIQPEPLLALKFHTANADTAAITIHYIPLTVTDAYVQMIQDRIFRTPQRRIRYKYFIMRGGGLTRTHPYLIRHRSRLPAVRLQQFIFHHTRKILTTVIPYMYLQQNFSRSFRDFVISHEQSSTGHFIFKVRVGNEDRIVRYQPAITIDATEVSKIKDFLCLSRRISRIVAVIGPYGNHVVLSPFQGVSHVNHYRQISSKMFGHQLTVDEYPAFPHNGFEVQKKFLSS